MPELICQGCDYEWTYRGQNPYVASCPRCKTSVTIHRSLDRLERRRNGKRPPAPQHLAGRSLRRPS